MNPTVNSKIYSLSISIQCFFLLTLTGNCLLVATLWVKVCLKLASENMERLILTLL